MADTFRIDLGVQVRDRVTGFTGRVTGRCQHLTGCNTYGVLKQADDKGDITDARWFDEQRLEVVDASPLKLRNVARGSTGTPKATRTVR